MSALGIFVLTLVLSYTYITAFLILHKHKYSFISRLRNRTAEEIIKLEKTGYMKATGRMLLAAAVIATLGLALEIMTIPYAFEISIIIFVLFLLLGNIFIQRYELKERRKIAYISSIITAIITIGIVLFVIVDFS